ncbi:DUF5064 family protein [Pseudomonas anguilliseptica]|uniref:DUF5064 family protein n=1 Tax=Pseudomonas anguilliseptica TaxID=53406 RepID=UPI001F187F20|nr:DUF5064 family protein [Pseudomonas anguilliseptica]MCE5362754.1 DUF5064 family protein [Pseudomonas anguilliseptica]
MFEPGHLHRANTIASGDMPLFSVDLFYEVRQDPSEGPMLHMRLQGQVNGQAFEEVFELHRDTAFNFASVASRLAHKHGLPINNSLIMRSHAEYDLMFEDIRSKLGAHSGEPVNLDHLQQDGL